MVVILVTLVEVAVAMVEWSGEKGYMLGQGVESNCAFHAQAEPIEAEVTAFR
jgi:hypothetical protein